MFYIARYLIHYFIELKTSGDICLTSFSEGRIHNILVVK